MVINDDHKKIADYIAAVAKGVVDNPDDVVVRPVAGEQTLVLNLEVNPRDLGKVIGKQGRMAQAMRTLLMAIATKHQIRAVLEIIE